MAKKRKPEYTSPLRKILLDKIEKLPTEVHRQYAFDAINRKNPPMVIPRNEAKEIIYMIIFWREQIMQDNQNFRDAKESRRRKKKYADN